MKKWILGLGVLGILNGCGDKDKTGSKPKRVDRATVTIDGVALPVDVQSCKAEVGQNGLEVRLYTGNMNATEIVLTVYEFQRQPGQFTFQTAPRSGVLLSDRSSGTASTYWSAYCTPRSFNIDIQGYDPVGKTVRGRFTTTICQINGTPSKVINSAEFDLPCFN